MSTHLNDMPGPAAIDSNTRFVRPIRLIDIKWLIGCIILVAALGYLLWHLPELDAPKYFGE